ncbi:MAG: DUF3667 domain-containing protein [Saprospiraceae bacterium]|nr:DUF3667 domain-containing protein [Saprospiraceae bacterium]
MECKSCGETLQGAYCSACGQKAINERITIRHIFSELFNIITNVDRGFLYTAKMLFIAPGQAIRNYLSGQTRRYYHPLRYIIILVAISVAVNLSLGLYDKQQSDIQSMVGRPDNQEVIQVQQQFNEIVKKYLNIIPLLLIPMLSFFSYLFFRKKGWNYAEHLVLNAYQQGQLAFIGIPFMLIGSLMPEHLALQVMYFIIPFGILYATYVYRQFFQVGWLQAFIKYVLIFIISYIILSILTGIAMIIFVMASGKM